MTDDPLDRVHLRGHTYLPLPHAEAATQTTIEVALDMSHLGGIHLAPGQRHAIGPDGWRPIPAVVRFTGAEPLPELLSTPAQMWRAVYLSALERKGFEIAGVRYEPVGTR